LTLLTIFQVMINSEVKWFRVQCTGLKEPSQSVASAAISASSNAG
jgi:hypothetical protein